MMIDEISLTCEEVISLLLSLFRLCVVGFVYTVCDVIPPQVEDKMYSDGLKH